MSTGAWLSEGTLASWNDERGFGFIALDDGSPNVFVHATAFQSRLERPREGEPLRFAIDVGADGKRRAFRVVRPALPQPAPAPRPSPRPSQRPAGAGDRRRRGPINLVALTAIAAFIVLYATVDALWSVRWWVALVYLGASALSLVVYAVDKSAATAGRWRISESSLLSIGILGGWPGAIIAQQLLRHKTKKASFRLAFWGTVLLNVVAFVVAASPLNPF